MCNYKLELSPNFHSRLIVDLHIKAADELLNDYYAKIDENCVYNDDSYHLHVLDGENICFTDDIYINGEKVIEKRNRMLFLDCFGVVKIEVVINGTAYVSDNLKVLISKKQGSQNIINMIDFIYNNCDKYLYEEHKYSKISSGIVPNSHISLDSKLSLLKKVYKSFVDCYRILRYSKHSKLINIEKIGAFSELQTIQPNTIEYISRHPDELQAVNYNSGIMVNKQHFHPNHTLVQAVSYSSDTYENQILVGFIKTIINELHEIKNYLNELKKSISLPREKDGYIESSYYIYTRNIKMYDDYLTGLDPLISQFNRLYIEYSNIMQVTEKAVISPPKYTNVFRSIMPYKIIFMRINEWFMCGKYDIEKNSLLLSFVSVSKIYEYFCLVKLNLAFEKCGFNPQSSASYKYNETKYYTNTTYNNTFELCKDNVFASIYFQPVIYGSLATKERPNNIKLFRNTSISISDVNALALLDEKPANVGKYYTPDYIIRMCYENKIKYYILDAKHSTPDNVKRYQLPYLVYKYLFSISTLSPNASIDGMYIFCGKSDNSVPNTENLHDIADVEKISIKPEADIIRLTGDDVNLDSQLIDLVKKLEQHILT